MENILFFETPLHRNSFPEDLFKEGGVLDNLLITFDGTILGVDKQALNSYLSAEDAKMIRLGYAKAPKDLKVEDQDSFYKYLSYCKYIED
jgi:hypothetical protein